MAAKTETPVSQFNLPKGAPFVPTKVPKLPKPTGQKRLETTQQPRQVGVQTPLEQAAAAKQGAEFAPIGYGGGPGTPPPEPAPYGGEQLPTSATAAGGTPGIGAATTPLPRVPDAPPPPTGGDPTGGDPTGGDPTGGDPTEDDPYADDYMLTAPDGTVYDARDTDSPYYDPKLDPNSLDYNPSLYKAAKGWAEVGEGSDEAYQNQFDSMDAEASKAASRAKRAAMARYGAAGMAGSGQYMQEMGAIDQAIWQANETAKGELWVKKVEADRQADIDRVRADLEFATGEEANQLQITLQTMLDDKDAEEALREMYWGGSDKLKDIFGADSFDSESHAQFMQDMSDAKKTGSEYAMEQVLGNIHYNDGELYYRSEWGDPTDTYVGPDGTEYENWFDYYSEDVLVLGTEAAPGYALKNIMSKLNIWGLIGESFEPGDSLPAQARVILEKFLLQNGMDPDFADDMWVMWGETFPGGTAYPAATPI